MESLKSCLVWSLCLLFCGLFWYAIVRLIMWIVAML